MQDKNLYITVFEDFTIELMEKIADKYHISGESLTRGVKNLSGVVSMRKSKLSKAIQHEISSKNKYASSSLLHKPHLDPSGLLTCNPNTTQQHFSLGGHRLTLPHRGYLQRANLPYSACRILHNFATEADQGKQGGKAPDNVSGATPGRHELD